MLGEKNVHAKASAVASIFPKGILIESATGRNVMASHLPMEPATPVEPSGPGGFAIFCFIVGAPHIYGVIQSHHYHPQGVDAKATSVRRNSGSLFYGMLAIAGLLAWVYWLI
jgi:hypothetical protein